MLTVRNQDATFNFTILAYISVLLARCPYLPQSPICRQSRSSF